MAPFRYRLEKLLEVRRRRQEEREKELGDVLRHRRSLQRELEELEREESSLEESLRAGRRTILLQGGGEKGLSLQRRLQFLRAWEEELKSLAEKIGRQRQLLLQQDREVEKARRRLAQAIKEVKGLEEHRARLRLEFERSEKRRAEQEEDEIGMQIFLRRKGNR